MQNANDNPFDTGEIAILSNAIRVAYGEDACLMVERQMDAARNDQARAIWAAVWDHLDCRERRQA